MARQNRNKGGRGFKKGGGFKVGRTIGLNLGGGDSLNFTSSRRRDRK